MNTGDVVGQYRVTHMLGEGGMGEVWKATDTMLEREVAIKVLRPEIARQKAVLDRFRQEAITLARLNHSGIAMVYNFIQHGDDFLMILEYVPGKTLEAVERSQGALDLRIAVPLFQKILESMQAAHEMQIYHRDIKPANIMLTTWGAVKLMDFGIARIVGAARQTREGALVGTLEYLSPERVKGREGGAEADIYALGTVLYELLAGRLPFINPNEYELMKMQLEQEPPSFAALGLSIPEPLEQAIRRSLAKEPSDRYSSCDEFRDALTEAVGPLTIAKRQITELVGQRTISQMGLAGHSVSSSAEIADFATTADSLDTGSPILLRPSPVPPSRNPVHERYLPDSDSAPAVSWLARFRVPLLVAAAVIVAIALGLGVGLLQRNGQASPDTRLVVPTPAAIQNAVAPGDNGSASHPPIADTPETPKPVPLQELGGGEAEAPISLPEEPAPQQKAPPQKRRPNLREKSLKALDQ
jgi:serine/threonine protein kinase